MKNKLIALSVFLVFFISFASSLTCWGSFTENTEIQLLQKCPSCSYVNITSITYPNGTTETYWGLSKKLNKEKAIRAVASANGANAISILIPCHRIIGSNGKLVGYAGGLSTKSKLLKLEQNYDICDQINIL